MSTSRMNRPSAFIAMKDSASSAEVILTIMAVLTRCYTCASVKKLHLATPWSSAATCRGAVRTHRPGSRVVRPLRTAAAEAAGYGLGFGPGELCDLVVVRHH